jgi:hypothetical protein
MAMLNNVTACLNSSSNFVMTEIINSLDDIKSLFWNITMGALGLDTTLTTNQGKVRISRQTTSSPAFKVTDDVVFIQIYPYNSSFAKQRDVGYSGYDSFNANRVINYSRVWEVSWICYGPNSSQNIETIRNQIFMPTFTNQAKTKNMYLITDTGMPRYAPEIFNDQWWERWDLSARYNEGVVRIDKVPYLNDINIVIQKGSA